MTDRGEGVRRRDLLRPAAALGLAGVGVATLPEAASAFKAASGPNAVFGWYDVTDYGADPMGAADSTTAIKNAIAAAPARGLVYFPGGEYKISGSITPPGGIAQGVVLSGASAFTLIRTSAATGDILTVSTDLVQIRNLSFAPATGTTRTSGFAINHALGNTLLVENCYFFNQYDGLRLKGNSDQARNIQLRDFANRGILIDDGNDQVLDRVLMDNAVAPAVGGIVLEATGCVCIANCDIIRSKEALRVAPGTGQGVFSVYASNSYFDTSQYGLRVSGTGFVERSRFVNCWFCSHSAHGVQLENVNIAGLTFLGCEASLNAGEGFRLLAGADLQVLSSTACGNGASGVATGPSVKSFQISDNVFRRTSGGGAGTGGPQQFAVYVSAGTYAYRVIANNVSYQNALGGFIDGGSGPASVVNNLTV